MLKTHFVNRISEMFNSTSWFTLSYFLKTQCTSWKLLLVLSSGLTSGSLSGKIGVNFYKSWYVQLKFIFHWTPYIKSSLHISL